MVPFHIQFLEELMREYPLSTDPTLLLKQLVLLAMFFRNTGDWHRYRLIQDILYYLLSYRGRVRSLRPSKPLQLEVVFLFHVCLMVMLVG
jgi:hypothetical protein